MACTGLGSERGQALVLLLGAIAAIAAGAIVLVAFGQALGGKSRHQRAVDLAAVSAAHRMRDDYQRLFEPATLPNGLPNPRHLTLTAYAARARSVATRNRSMRSCHSASVTSPTRHDPSQSAFSSRLSSASM